MFLQLFTDLGFMCSISAPFDFLYINLGTRGYGASILLGVVSRYFVFLIIYLLLTALSNKCLAGFCSVHLVFLSSLFV